MYQYESRVRYSETDSRGKLSLPDLLEYFQDASIFHSEELGLGVQYLREKGQLWALSSWQIVIYNYPKLCEKITVGTAPYDFKGFIGFRNFWMLNEAGEQLAVANSVWSLIQVADGKPVKPSQDMLDGYKLSPKLDMEYADRKVKLEGEGKAYEPITVMPHHLDTNMHVNNGQYVRIAMNYLPREFSIGQLRAEYKMQAVLGTKLYPVVYDFGKKIGVSLQDEKGAVYCNIKVTSAE